MVDLGRDVPGRATPRSYFEEIYRDRADPWNFATDSYELARYDALLEHVPAGRYRRGFEPGCSVGVLTYQLGRRCRSVLATDIAPPAVRTARRRCRDLANVEIRCQELAPGTVPAGPVDLVVLAEIGYYFAAEQLPTLIEGLGSLLPGGGRLVAQHWLGRSRDHTLAGRDVHEALTAHLAGFRHVAHRKVPDDHHDGFLLDVWDKDDR